jgi:hypothetical protein
MSIPSERNGEWKSKLWRRVGVETSCEFAESGELEVGWGGGIVRTVKGER